MKAEKQPSCSRPVCLFQEVMGGLCSNPETDIGVTDERQQNPPKSIVS